MNFNYLVNMDSEGTNIWRSISRFDYIVFCCLPISKFKCNPYSIKELEMLAHRDEKFYLVSYSSENKFEMLRILEIYISDIQDDLDEHDFFLVMHCSAFKSGEAFSFSLYPIAYQEKLDPDYTFSMALKELRSDIRNKDIRKKICDVAIASVKKIVGLFSSGGSAA